MEKITYTNKEALNEIPSIEAKNKVQAADMNEIKNVVNQNADNVGNIVIVPTETPTEDTKIVIESEDFGGIDGSGTYITNTYSESTEVGYSANYSNKAFKGSVLWANSSPTSEFSPQTITFNGTYDYYDVISWVDGVTFETTRVYLSKRTIIQIMEGGYTRIRYATATNNSIEFSKGTFYATYASGTDNNYQCIPYQIIGYKS